MVLVFSILPAIVLFLAITGNWNYGPLTLRWIVTVSAALVLLNLRGRGDWIWYGILLAILVAFNPFVPIRPLAPFRVMVEIAAAISFVATALTLSRT